MSSAVIPINKTSELMLKLKLRDKLIKDALTPDWMTSTKDTVNPTVEYNTNLSYLEGLKLYGIKED